MLYVFHVDTGTMMTFDINLALESVDSLKLMIERVCHIPATSQVLLVSGGEVLRPDARVCSYSAGTDTNPIYMFSKTIIESYEPPRSTCDYGSDVDLRDQVDVCLTMAANYSTVVACSQLAQQFWELAREHTHVCEKLVHDQHLQQQGWAAVVANMEDVTYDFQERAEDFEEKFKEHLKRKDEYTEFLSRFNEDLDTLSCIPILPALRLNAASNPFTAFDELHADSESYSEKNDLIGDENDEIGSKMSLEEEQKDNIGVTIIQTDIQGTTGSNDGSSKTSSLQGAGGSTASEGDEGIEISREGQDMGSARPNLSRGSKSRQSTREALTLLHWITAKENQESLRDIARYCKNALELFDGSVMTTLRGEVSDALLSAGQDGMKRIKGLEERLCGLEQLMCEAKRIEQEQKDSAQSLMQNQQKAANLGDVSVLRMLCESHCQQLQSMLRNQQRLRDVRARCARAKEELAINLYHRLKWIVYVENRMFETDSRLMFYHRSLARLKRHLAVIGQLHRAPRLFCTAVHEIVRRRTFSQAFLAWASDLASHLLTIHNEEVERRRDFHTLFSGHFLGGLFPGTDDVPPAFATVAPAVFDTALPRLTITDVDTLTSCLPHLAPEILPCDMTPVTQFFISRSGNQEKSVERQIVDERILAVVREAGLDRGFESETDTEEFEKVGRSPIERGAADAASIAPLRADAATLTEDNLISQRSEADGLREMLSSMSHICSESINLLKEELGKLKTETYSHQTALKNHCSEILTAWDRCNTENAVRERETLQRLTVDHELEMNDIKQALSKKDEEMRTLQTDNSSLKSQYSQIVDKQTAEISSLQTQITAFEESAKEHTKQLEELELCKQKALKGLQEKMAHDYKAELESLRSRFRLVTLTSMDRSPSESSLEKIERTDMIEISNHKAILSQAKEDSEIEKDAAIKAVLEKQEEEWKEKLANEFKMFKVKNESEKQINLNDAVKRIMEEKERQLDQSRERESILMRECMKYKEIIQQLNDPETTDYPSSTFLQARNDNLELENTDLKEQLNSLKNQPTIDKVVKEQQTEIVSIKNSSTSPDPKIRQKSSKCHAPLSFAPGTFSTSSCNDGDIVLIMWNQEYMNYSIFQDSYSLFLLHVDCLPALNLKIPPQDDEKFFYSFGKVESKNHCVANKSPNRYNVPLKDRFFRVNVKPLKSCSCDILLSKEKESSQRKSSSGMSVSTCSYSSSRSRTQELSKSVCVVPSEVSLPNQPAADKTERRSLETAVGAPLPEESEDAEEPAQERMDSIESNNAETAVQPSIDVQTNLCLNSVPLQKTCDAPSVEKRMAASVPNVGLQANIIYEPEESVPYDVNEACNLDPSFREQFISEVGEEAAP